MIDPKYSNIPRLRVAVPSESCRFANECALCGSSVSAPTIISFERVFILGAAALLTESTLTIPLCNNHIQAYEESTRRQSMKVSGIFALGLALGFVPAAIFGDPGLKKTPIWVGPVCGFGLVLIVLSFFLMLKKWSSFPIKFARKGTRYILTFPDEASMKRFLAANDEKDADV